MTHIVLLGGSIAAEFAVAIGIVLESPKEKAFREKIGMVLVLGGVSMGALLTISLFVYDEGISRSQNSLITQMRFPRSLDSKMFSDEIKGLKPEEVEVLYDANAPDASFIADGIWGALFNAHWAMASSTGAVPLSAPPSNILPWANMPWTEAAGGSAWGLSVVTNDVPDLDKNPVGNALVRALADSVHGPSSGATLAKSHGDLPAGRVRIIVGPKLP